MLQYQKDSPRSTRVEAGFAHLVLVVLLALGLVATTYLVIKGPLGFKPKATTDRVILNPDSYLFIDDHLIESSSNLVRKVNEPTRFLSGPIIPSSSPFLAWQPYMTVLQDNGRFKMWYNSQTNKLFYTESSDGVSWGSPTETNFNAFYDTAIIDDSPNSSQRYKVAAFVKGSSPGVAVDTSADGIHWNSASSGGGNCLSCHGDDDCPPPPDDSNRGYCCTGDSCGSLKNLCTFKDWQNNDCIAGSGSGGYGTTVYADTWGIDRIGLFWNPLSSQYSLIMGIGDSYSWTDKQGRAHSSPIRRVGLGTSADFSNWSGKNVLFSPDSQDSGVTQWYTMGGILRRGDLFIGLLQVLRDDLTASGAPQDAIEENRNNALKTGTDVGAGMGYTVLAWSRDGLNWFRDRETDPFFEPDPQAGAWDHAHAWMNSQVIAGDEVYIYYGGYKWGHKYQAKSERQIGMVKMKKDRYVARENTSGQGILRTNLVTFNGNKLGLNIDSSQGEAKIQFLDSSNNPLSGFSFADCQIIKTDSLDASVSCKGSFWDLKGKDLKIEISLSNAKIYALNVSFDPSLPVPTPSPSIPPSPSPSPSSSPTVIPTPTRSPLPTASSVPVSTPVPTPSPVLPTTFSAPVSTPVPTPSPVLPTAKPSASGFSAGKTSENVFERVKKRGQAASKNIQTTYPEYSFIFSPEPSPSPKTVKRDGWSLGRIIDLVNKFNDDLVKYFSQILKL